MIVVTPKGAPRPVKSRRTVVIWDALADPAGAILSTLANFPNDDVLYVAPGAVVREREVSPRARLLGEFDVAACVDRIGSIPDGPVQFDGIGKVSTDTILVRQTPAARRLVERWAARNAAAPGLEDVNLCIALRETDGVRFRFLRPEWRWRPGTPGLTSVDAVVWFPQTLDAAVPAAPRPSDLAATPSPKPKPAPLGPGVCWVGHLYQYTGYGKMNRELLFRVANSLAVHLDDSHKEPCYVSEDLRRRLDVHKSVLVGTRAPLLRVMGPDWISGKERHRICYTMQESSERVHPDMVKRANENFDELWTPTAWNAQVFRDSGIRLPITPIPLGVDTEVFRPRKRGELPPCRLISDRPHRGKVVPPDGFTFLTVGLPGFRKSWDVIADAMELAFKGLRDAPNLVIGLTHSPGAWNEKVYRQFARYKVPIWTLEGSFSEHELSRIYNSVDAYVSASRGEGMNLPALEAAACGLPVVVPDNTAHTEIFGPECFLFKPDGVKTYPEGDWISDWYVGQLFSRFGKKSIRALAEILESVWRSGVHLHRLTEMRRRIERQYTWDVCAREVTRRLLEVQP